MLSKQILFLLQSVVCGSINDSILLVSTHLRAGPEAQKVVTPGHVKSRFVPRVPHIDCDFPNYLCAATAVLYNKYLICLLEHFWLLWAATILTRSYTYFNR